MKSYIIFPQTAWLNTELGFAGIKNLSDEMTKRNIKFEFSRELQAIIFEFQDLNEKTMELIREKLPKDYEIPALLEGKSCAIISKNEVMSCDRTNKKFEKLMQDAYLDLSTERKIDESLSLADINKLCDDFADSEGMISPLKEFDIERLHEGIYINEIFQHKFVKILVDIKSIWFAMDYDLLQLGRNTGNDANARFKRYIFLNNAIVRIRALGEKLIGLAILLEHPEDFDKILSAKKIRAKFIKNFKDSEHPVVKAIWDYSHSIDTFEQRFRTPELHKIGRTIWWASQEKLGEETNRLIAYRNDLNILLRNIIKEFEKNQK